jgi:hypothetical protein
MKEERLPADIAVVGIDVGESGSSFGELNKAAEVVRARRVERRTATSPVGVSDVGKGETTPGDSSLVTK